jgi:hypothetical protein
VGFGVPTPPPPVGEGAFRWPTRSRPPASWKSSPLLSFQSS